MPLRLTLALAVVVVGAMVAQKPDSTFVIDESKPYVYIKLDHVGKRKTLSDDEDSRGLWLRLVNNCRIPITVRTFDPGTGDPGVGILDEIIPVSNEILHTGDGKQPEGYSSEIASSTTIAPGGNLLFSVPLNHVSPRWYLRIEFEMQLSKKAAGVEPYSYLDFSWGQLPLEYRNNSSSPK